MDQPELLRKAVEAFEAAGAEYMLVGSVASAVYGEPRLTLDITGILKVSGTDMDLAYIERWASHKGVTDVWKAVLSRVKR